MHFAWGMEEVCSILTEPRLLDKGKSAWHCYSAAVDFFPTLRELNHPGICVSHYCFDRALFSAMVNRIRRRHEAQYSVHYGQGLESSHMQQLLDWSVFTGCTNHDCQNVTIAFMEEH